ncbi:MAG: hypothetical protein AAFN09_06175 [Pseudomonadota bacterium]
MNVLKTAMATCLAGLFMSGGSAQALDTDFQIPVDGDFVESGLRNFGMPDPYTMRVAFMGQEGRIVICGIGFVREARLRSNIRGMLRDAEVTVGGRVYPVDLTFFAQANSAREVETGMANCAITPAPIPTRSEDFDFNFGGAGIWRE